jgi:hypothetical protein
MEAREVQDAVQEKYGSIARSIQSGAASCCGPSCCSTDDPISGNLYSRDQTSGVPSKALDASLGCGNPDGPRPARGRPGRSTWGLRRRHRRVLAADASATRARSTGWT